MLVRKYSQVVQRYYVQYLVGFDAIQLSESIQSIYGNQANQQYFLQDPSYIIFQSVIRTISGLSVKQGIRNYEIIICLVKMFSLHYTIYTVILLWVVT